MKKIALKIAIFAALVVCAQLVQAQKKVLFVFGNQNVQAPTVPTAPAAGSGDALMIARLQSLGAQVTLESGYANYATYTGDLVGKDLVIISESVGSGDVNVKFRDTTVPVIVCEAQVFDDMNLTGPTNATDFGDAIGGISQLVMVNAVPQPYLAGGFPPGPLTVMTSGDTPSWGQYFGAGVVRVATLPDANNTKFGIFGYYKGTQMWNNFIAPGRRVGSFMRQSCVPKLTAAGWTLFDTMYQWALGADSAGPLPFTKQPYPQYPNYVLPAVGLVGHFTMDSFSTGGGTKSTVVQLDGGGTNNINNNLFVVPGAPGLGKAVRNIGNQGNIQWAPTAKEDWTISFWIRTWATGSSNTGFDNAKDFWNSPILNVDRGGYGWPDWGITLNYGKIGIGQDKLNQPAGTDNRSVRMSLSSNKPINDGQWHWVFITRESITGRVVIAIDDGQFDWTQGYLYTGPQYGQDANGNGAPNERLLDGSPDVMLDDFYEFTRVLGDGELYNIWTRATTGVPPTDFVRHITFDELPDYYAGGMKNACDPNADLGLTGFTTSTMAISGTSLLATTTTAKIGGTAIKFFGAQLNSLPFSNMTWTVAFWIKSSDFCRKNNGNEGAFYDCTYLYGHDVGGVTRDYCMGIQNGRLVAGIDNNDEQNITLRTLAATPITGPNNSEWHHVAWARNGVNGDSRLYVDGVVVDSIPIVPNGNSGMQNAMNDSQIMDSRVWNTTIGDPLYNVKQILNTTIDDFLIYNVQLTDDQIFGISQANTNNAIKKTQWSVFE